MLRAYELRGFEFRAFGFQTFRLEGRQVAGSVRRVLPRKGW